MTELIATTEPSEGFVYLAVPHSHENEDVMNLRCTAADKAMMKLMKLGLSVYSPISMTHRASKSDDAVGISHGDWLRLDYPFLIACTAVFLLRLPGWRESRGVKWELEACKDFHKPLIHLNPQPYIWHWPVSFAKLYPDEVTVVEEENERQ